MPSIFEKIQAKLEVYRLEKRYTRNRHRRSNFISNALYVDGEYVYQTATSTGSSTASSSAASTPIDERRRDSLDAYTADMQQRKKDKKAKRQSLMPGFGSSPDWRRGGGDIEEER